MIEMLREYLTGLNPLYVGIGLFAFLVVLFLLFASRFIVLKKKDDRPEALRRLDEATQDIKSRLENGELSAQSKIPDELKEAASLADKGEYDEVNDKIDNIEEQLDTSYDAGPSEEEVI